MDDLNFDTQRLGTLLLFVGVSAWAPFIYLLATGRTPSIYPFLAVHLTGVVGGSRLRAYGAPAGERKQRPRRQILGRIMILLGVLAWLPYFYQKLLLERLPAIDPYLAVHLTGVLGGLALLLSLPLARGWRRLRQQSAMLDEG